MSAAWASRLSLVPALTTAFFLFEIPFASQVREGLASGVLRCLEPLCPTPSWK